jgi:hypothetical protein
MNVFGDNPVIEFGRRNYEVVSEQVRDYKVKFHVLPVFVNIAFDVQC